MPLVDGHRLDQMYSHTPRPSLADAQQVLFRRAAVLGEKDRMLLELAFKNNLSIRQIGRIFQRPAGTISRRVARLCARLRDPIVVALLEPDCALAAPYRELAIEYFVHRKPLDHLAVARSITRTEVRDMLNFVRGWHKGSSAVARRRAVMQPVE
jgi:hypothetical protein